MTFEGSSRFHGEMMHCRSPHVEMAVHGSGHSCLVQRRTAALRPHLLILLRPRFATRIISPPNSLPPAGGHSHTRQSFMNTYDRRAFMAYFASIGLGSTLLPGMLWAQVQGSQQGPEITKEAIAAAEEIAGLKFTDEERAAMANGLRQARANIQQLHQVPLDLSVFPAIVFDPVPPGQKLAPRQKAAMIRSKVPVMPRPGSLDELAYAGVAARSEMVRSRKVKPSELTDMYLSRLKQSAPQLHFVINLTEERA